MRLRAVSQFIQLLQPTLRFHALLSNLETQERWRGYLFKAQQNPKTIDEQFGSCFSVIPSDCGPVKIAGALM